MRQTRWEWPAAAQTTAIQMQEDNKHKVLHPMPCLAPPKRKSWCGVHHRSRSWVVYPGVSQWVEWISMPSPEGTCLLHHRHHHHHYFDGGRPQGELRRRRRMGETGKGHDTATES